MVSEDRPRYRVLVHDEVYTELSAAYGYFLAFSVPAADMFARRYEDVVTSLEEFPRLGARIPEFRRDKVERRHRFVGDYRVIYAIVDLTVRVIFLRHGRRRRLTRKDLDRR